mmetsp:Transcript_4581/g.8651  ORF Transcript_4581/g.8651 Transcript_4581/m.8651 type:complete len:130 (-) Transcript_4581:87-476(-)
MVVSISGLETYPSHSFNSLPDASSTSASSKKATLLSSKATSLPLRSRRSIFPPTDYRLSPVQPLASHLYPFPSPHLCSKRYPPRSASCCACGRSQRVQRKMPQTVLFRLTARSRCYDSLATLPPPQSSS